MKKILTYMTMVAAMLLASCTEDAEQDKQMVKVELAPCVPSYIEEEMLTRGWIPPSGYKPYNELNGMFDGQTNLVNSDISIFFTRNNETPEAGRFSLGSDGKWHSTVIINGGIYYLYGFIPKMDRVTASISSSSTPNDNSSYSQGSVLSINGLSSVTPTDVCVVVGASNGADDYKENEDYTVSRLKTGCFEYAASGNSNFVYLLFDHLYSAMRFKINVDEAYNELRTIKLKELKLVSYNGNNPVKEKVNVIITLTGRNDGNSPITNVTYEYDNNSGDVQGTIFQSEEGLVLTTTGQNFRGSFVPLGVTKFKLISTYDVYDKKGNRVRKDCTAENMLEISQLFENFTNAQRGQIFNLSLSVIPTYLYMLSDPDLDNPTITIN